VDKIVLGEWVKQHPPNTQKQIKKIAKYIKDNGGNLDVITTLKLRNLATWITTAEQAQASIQAKGLEATFNGGKTIGLHPLFKALESASKMIYKALDELGIKAPEVEQEEDDWLACLDEK